MDLELAGKAALVTGSSKGIGKAIARALVGEGARVMLCARGAEALEATRSELSSLGEVQALTADVMTEEGARSAVEATTKAFGAIDLLVNNVGGSRGSGATGMVTSVAFRDVIDANLTSAFLCSSYAVDAMKKTGSGAIVHISSIYGREYATSAAYTAAKAALIALSKEMAVDLAHYGIRVNTVAPGSIFFPGGSWDRRQKAEPEKVARMVETEIPWKRFGRPEEIADAVVYLLSARASWVTGACLPVDGGQGRAF